jgi:hypothetical protein
MCSALLFACGRFSKKEAVRSLSTNTQTEFSDTTPPSKEPWFTKTNVEVREAVLGGERLPQPKNCPGELYKLMLACWRENPDERPTFRTILADLLTFSRTLQVEKAEVVQINQKDEPEQ